MTTHNANNCKQNRPHALSNYNTINLTIGTYTFSYGSYKFPVLITDRYKPIEKKNIYSISHFWGYCCNLIKYAYFLLLQYLFPSSQSQILVTSCTQPHSFFSNYPAFSSSLSYNPEILRWSPNQMLIRCSLA